MGKLDHPSYSYNRQVTYQRVVLVNDTSKFADQVPYTSYRYSL